MDVLALFMFLATFEGNLPSLHGPHFVVLVERALKMSVEVVVGLLHTRRNSLAGYHGRLQ